uniref:Integrase catalytic domain-containing protein n=1 Tax=Takifugu rubripes TaxID=31033 RepID=A0A674NX61_TAKRU
MLQMYLLMLLTKCIYSCYSQNVYAKDFLTANKKINTSQTSIPSHSVFNMSETRFMEKVYYDPAHPGSLSGVERLHKGVQEEMGKTVPRENVKTFLQGQDAYTLHKPARIHFPRNRVFAPRPLNQFQADLCDMQALSEHNDGYNYLLTVIDIFSKKAYVRALKRKSAAEVVKAFESIFESSQTPEKIQTDAGKEFFNKSFEALMRKHNIVHFSTASHLKASVIERFNRTLKGRMWRYFTANNTLRYTDVLQDLVKSYNHSYHSSIKMKPAEVTSENTFKVFQNLYGKSENRRKVETKMNFKKGDLVRISKLRGVFDKKYEQSFTNEVFTVSERIPRDPPVYKLKDYDGEPIQGSFYEPELQKVTMGEDRLFHVEKILKHRVVRGEKQVFVSWKNWPEKFNSWIKAADLKNV